jgi:hypothetical protein
MPSSASGRRDDAAVAQRHAARSARLDGPGRLRRRARGSDEAHRDLRGDARVRRRRAHRDRVARQEINGANWLLSTEDTTPRGREILEFCEDNVYPVLDRAAPPARRRRDPVRLRLRRARLRVERRAVRDVDRARQGQARRESGSGRRIYLRKLAHIRQLASRRSRSTASPATSRRSSSGSSTASRSIASPIPADKLLLWTYDKQGDDYWGVPPTRHCYKAWTFKRSSSG